MLIFEVLKFQRALIISNPKSLSAWRVHCACMLLKFLKLFSPLVFHELGYLISYVYVKCSSINLAFCLIILLHVYFNYGQHACVYACDVLASYRMYIMDICMCKVFPHRPNTKYHVELRSLSNLK